MKDIFRPIDVLIIVFLVLGVVLNHALLLVAVGMIFFYFGLKMYIHAIDKKEK